METSGGSAYSALSSGTDITGTTLTGLPGVSAKAVSTTTVGVTVTQTYNFLQPNVLKVTDTITNTSGGPLTGVLFQRDVDWDVAPTEFNENSFGNPIPVGSNITDSTYYGFDSIDPSVPYFEFCAGGCNLTGDLGGGISVSLPNLAPGASDTQTYLYGISQAGENVNGLIADVNADGAYTGSPPKSENGPIRFGHDSAIIAVASSAIPEPSTWAMMGLGFAGLAFAGYRPDARRASPSPEQDILLHRDRGPPRAVPFFAGCQGTRRRPSCRCRKKRGAGRRPRKSNSGRFTGEELNSPIDRLVRASKLRGLRHPRGPAADGRAIVSKSRTRRTLASRRPSRRVASQADAHPGIRDCDPTCLVAPTRQVGTAPRSVEILIGDGEAGALY